VTLIGKNGPPLSGPGAGFSEADVLRSQLAEMQAKVQLAVLQAQGQTLAASSFKSMAMSLVIALGTKEAEGVFTATVGEQTIQSLPAEYFLEQGHDAVTGNLSLSVVTPDAGPHYLALKKQHTEAEVQAKAQVMSAFGRGPGV